MEVVIPELTVNLTVYDTSDGTSSNFSDNSTSSEDTVTRYPFYVIERLYLIIPVSVFGVLFNMINIAVLTRSSMHSSINILLTGLAISDLITIIFEVVVPMIIQSLLPPEVPLTYSTYGWAVIYLLDYYVAFWFAVVSNWITVTVSSWRYVAITWPLRAQVLCTSTRAKMATFLIVGLSSVVAIPLPLLYNVRVSSDFNSSLQIYELVPSAISERFPLLHIYQIIYITMKIVPSVILVYITKVLIQTLCKAASTRRKLLQENNHSKDTGRQCDRTTVMMLLIVLLFLVSNLPYSILLLLDYVLGSEHFNGEEYLNSLDYFQLALLINYSATFFIYFVISRKFRETLFGFLVCVLHRKPRPPFKSNTSTDTVDTVNDRENFELNYGYGTSNLPP